MFYILAFFKRTSLLTRIFHFSAVLFTAFFIHSCKDNNRNSEGQLIVLDTTDSLQEQKTSDTRAFSNNDSNPEQLSTRNEDFMSDSVLVFDKKIVYDDDFEPSVSVKIRNKMQLKIIALELVIDPNINQKKEERL